ncbi:MAG TPA: serine/threonine-protein kinase, partial [Anaeromyxobacteraceae bacterium]|nr:serine/threonine-protein kinase [Anaeromyxobacteraceae bacterium]
MTIPEGSLTRLLREALSPDDAKGSSWDPALFPGAVVGRFEMLRELGRGGFGTVWEARDTALKRRVAFKAIRGAGRGAADDRALAEAEAAAHLLHPNVVTLFDLGRSEHGAFLVMELLEGRSLAAALEEGPFPPAEAVRIGAGIAAGLAHAHAKGILHRDLTPSNVFLCANGDVKLLDLGLSRVLGRDGGHVGPGDGTPGHAPPERLRGEPEDARGDLYALGLLLQLMLTGALPDEVRRPGTVGVRVPGWEGLATLVARLLDDDPGRRPA